MSNISNSGLNSFLIYLSLVGFPIVGVFTQILNIESFFYSTILRLMVGIVALLIIFINFNKINIFKKNLFLIIFIFFIFFYCLRIYVDTIILDLPLLKEPFYYWIWFYGACLVPFLAVTLCDKVGFINNNTKYYLYLTLLVVTILSLIFGSSMMASEYSQDLYNSGRFRLESINPISLGHIGVILSALSIYFFKPRNYFLFSLVNLIGFVLGVYLTILSNSRGPLIALCFILILILTRKYKNFVIVIPIFLSLLSFLLLYLYSFVSVNYEIYTFDRFLSIGGSVSNLDDERFYLYKSAFNGFFNYPVFGYGLEDYSSGYYPHNYYLEAFMATGFFGGISFLLVSFYSFFKSLFFDYKYLWISIFYIDNFISGMFSGAIYSSANFWVSLALVFSLILYKNRLDFDVN